MGFGRGALLWLLGIPLPIILLLALFGSTEEHVLSDLDVLDAVKIFGGVAHLVGMAEHRWSLVAGVQRNDVLAVG
jgi:hypothetical protein